MTAATSIFNRGDMTEAAQVMATLTAIEQDLAERQNEYERAASDKARLIRDWDYRFALHHTRANGSDAASRKSAALVAAIEQDDLYDRLKAAESAYAALQTVMNTLDRRATVSQSVLKAMGRA